MKALLEAMLLYKHQSLYETYEGRTKSSNPYPDFRFVAHLSALYAQKWRQNSELVFLVYKEC